MLSCYKWSVCRSSASSFKGLTQVKLKPFLISQYGRMTWAKRCVPGSKAAKFQLPVDSNIFRHVSKSGTWRAKVQHNSRNGCIWIKWMGASSCVNEHGVRLLTRSSVACSYFTTTYSQRRSRVRRCLWCHLPWSLPGHFTSKITSPKPACKTHLWMSKGRWRLLTWQEIQHELLLKPLFNKTRRLVTWKWPV